MGDRGRSLIRDQRMLEPEVLTPGGRDLALCPIVQEVVLMLAHLLGLLRVPMETLGLPAALRGG